MGWRRTEPDRAPSDGERGLIGSVFGPAIDPDRMRFRHAKFWPLQPRAVVMAPDGDIWFHPDSPDWRDDFTGAALSLRAFVVHELTHVWQHQQGIRLWLRRPPFARYRYRLTPGKPFRRYGIEQQAMIIQHAYVAACKTGELHRERPLLARIVNCDEKFNLLDIIRNPTLSERDK